MKNNTTRTKYAVSIAATVTILFIAIFAVNESFATSISLSKTSNQEQTIPVQNTVHDDRMATIQDNENLEEKGASDNNMYEAEGVDEDKPVEPQFVDSNYITPAHAKSIATTFISVDISDAKTVSLDTKNGKPVYSIDVTKNGQPYEINVDAVDGNVLTASQDTIDESVNDIS